MENKDHLIKDSLILFAASSAVNIANFVFHMGATRSLGPELYGSLAALLGLVVIFAMPSLALQVTVTKKTSVLLANDCAGSVGYLFKRSLKWFLGAGLVLFILFFVFRDFFSSRLQINDPWAVVVLGLIAVAAMLVPLVRGILQGMQKFYSFGLNLFADAFIRLSALGIVMLLGFKLKAVLFTSFAASITAFLIGVFMIREVFRQDEKPVTVITKKEFLKYAMPVFLSMTGFSLLSYMDLFMVKYFFPPEQAGFYAVTSVIGKAFLYFPSAVVMALFPKVSAAHALNQDTKKMFYKSLWMTAAISGAGIMFCYLLPEFVIKLLAGGQYLEIAGVVKIFGLAILPLVLFNVLINYSLAVHNYFFIWVMYAGILLYAGALYFFHASFGQVIFVLFAVSALILAVSVAGLEITGRMKK